MYHELSQPLSPCTDTLQARELTIVHTYSCMSLSGNRLHSNCYCPGDTAWWPDHLYFGCSWGTWDVGYWFCISVAAPLLPSQHWITALCHSSTSKRMPLQRQELAAWADSQNHTIMGLGLSACDLQASSFPNSFPAATAWIVTLWPHTKGNSCPPLALL